jgi:predicted TIM-barrel fold metal-dependent hydrolase
VGVSRQAMCGLMEENADMVEVLKSDQALDAGLPIIDSHHHLLDKISESLTDHMGGLTHFLIDDYVHFIGDSHNVIGTVAVEARQMYRVDGPPEFAPIGETEFLNGQAAMAASGVYGKTRVAAGIVSKANCVLGDRVRSVLEAHIEAAPKRFKGIRHEACWDADSSVLGGLFDLPPHLYGQKLFREGFRHIGQLGLSFDAFVLAPQLGDVTDLARSFPETQIILCHVGQPLAIGVYRGKLAEEFPKWKQHLADIAACPNVVIKLGGLGAFLSGSPNYRSIPPATVSALVSEWKPYVETAVELFGANRCMFESNVPTDGSGTFNAVCNAYKTMTSGCSMSEKRDIFARTAARVYRLELPGLT